MGTARRHCFSTLAQTIPSWAFTAGFDGLRPDALRSRGNSGAEADCAIRGVNLSLDHCSWLNRRVCVMDFSDVSRRMGVRVVGFIGADVLSEFAQ